MIIDGHAHACGIYMDKQLILENLNKQGIDKVILSAGEPGSSKNYSFPNFGKLFKSSSLIYFFNKIIGRMVEKSGAARFIDSENERIAKMAERNPDHIMNTYWADICDKDCIEKIKSFALKHDFAMIKMHQCWNHFNIKDRNCIEIVKYAGEMNKPIFIHLSTKEQVHEFISVADEYKDTMFIVAHLIGIEEFDNGITDNIYFDISCPELNSMKMLKRAYELVGAGRLILGSDTPYGINNIEKAIERLKALNMSESEIDLVCGQNIEKLLHKNS